jgi:hypothetical protein
MPEFWRASGYHLLDRDRPDGRLGVTDEFLRAYVRRPEMRPVEESCDAECELHAALLANPRLAVPPARIEALADPDARDNYRVLLAFRDRLVAADTVEAAYLSIFRESGASATAAARVPPLFIDQLAHVLVRRVLDDATSPLRARAGELFFRTQTVSLQDGAVLLADSETVEMLATSGGFGSLGRLVAEAQTPLRQVELDVLCRVLEAWVGHFLESEVSIVPVQAIRDERWVWHVGLDAEATTILNDLYNGVSVEDERLGRLLSLFRLEFVNPADMRADIAGRPVYLGLAMTAQKTLRLKPQNLLVNLPLARRA